MLRRSLSRSFVGLIAAALLGVLAATPAQAYGAENFQTAFAGTGVFPGTGGFGFWGWCAFGGGGTNGDCQFAQYVHAPSGSFTCHESLDITSWIVTTAGFGFPNFTITGTVSVTPTSQTGPCLVLFPGLIFLTGPNSFAGAPTGIPAAAGHYNLGSILGAVGEFEIQVTAIR